MPLILGPVLPPIFPVIAVILSSLEQFLNLLLYSGAQALQYDGLQTQG